jgi:molybdopterin-containing oxidoreductase family membrane subunit
LLNELDPAAPTYLAGVRNPNGVGEADGCRSRRSLHRLTIGTGHRARTIVRLVTDQIASIVQTPDALGLDRRLRHRLRRRSARDLCDRLFIKGTYIWASTSRSAGVSTSSTSSGDGIGHAGTLISASCCSSASRGAPRSPLRRSDDPVRRRLRRHVPGHPHRPPWLAYWLLPYPNTMGMWPNFRSPLIWDVFAVSTYATVSLLFWFVGLIPDLATLRDRSENTVGRTIYGLLAMGWRGSAQHWQRYETAYLLLAALSTPLVLSVHTIVSFDFAVGQVPGWHATVFPPYFVAGAIFAGFAMVMIIAIPSKFYGLQDFITMRHFDYMGRITLATGLVVGYGHGRDLHGLLQRQKYEIAVMMHRFVGPYAPLYWMLIFCNVISIQALWFQRVRQSLSALFVISIIVSIGMWLERFIIIPVSLSRDFLPSSWGMYYPTFWDWSTFVGTLGLFIMLLFLFIRLLPMISIFEVRTLLPESKVNGGDH